MLKEKILKVEKKESVHQFIKTHKSRSTVIGIYCAIKLYPHVCAHYDTFFNYMISLFFSTGSQLYSVHSVQ